MPAAIGAAILAEVAAGTTLATSAVAASVVGYAVISGALLAVQQIVEALTRPRSATTPRSPCARRSHRAGWSWSREAGGCDFLPRRAGRCAQPRCRALRRSPDPDPGILARRREDRPDGQVGGVVPDAVYQGKVVIEGSPGSDDQAALGTLARVPVLVTARS